MILNLITFKNGKSISLTLAERLQWSDMEGKDHIEVTDIRTGMVAEFSTGEVTYITSIPVEGVPSPADDAAGVKDAS